MMSILLRPDRVADGRPGPRAAAHADAGADGVEREIAGISRRSWRANPDRGRTDLILDGAVLDLRQFHGEQIRHELWISARQEDPAGPRWLAAHVIDPKEQTSIAIP